MLRFHSAEDVTLLLLPGPVGPEGPRGLSGPRGEMRRADWTSL